MGGGEGLEGVYGSITAKGMRLVLDSFKDHAGLDAKSVFLDIGSGLGRPVLHAIIHSNVIQSYGIECDPVKLQKATHFMRSVIHELSPVFGQDMFPPSSLPNLICSPIEKLPSLEGATHIYSAWEGFSVEAMEAVGKLFAASQTARAICIVQRSFRALEPEEAMLHLGFGRLKLVLQAPVFMSGSRRQLVAYVFVREQDPETKSRKTRPPRPPGLSSMEYFTVDDVISRLKSKAGCLDPPTARGSKRARGQEEIQHAHGLRGRSGKKPSRLQEFDCS